MKAIGGFASVATKLILPPEVAALPPHVSPSLTEAEQEWLLRREQLLARIQHREPRTELPPPRTEPSFADAVRELGFHSDIDFVPSDQPLSRHRTLWRVHLPDQLPELHERFRSVHDEVKHIAFDEGLRSGGGRGKASGRGRRRILDELLTGIADHQDRPPDDTD